MVNIGDDDEVMNSQNGDGLLTMIVIMDDVTRWGR